MPRTIPKLPALALAVTASACSGDPMVGDWDGTFLHIGGYDPVDLPFDTEVRPGYDYHLEIATRMTKSGNGAMTFSEDRVIDGAETSVDNNYTISSEVLSRGNWLLDIPGYDELVLDCTADRSKMECLGDDALEVTYIMEFARAEE